MNFFRKLKILNNKGMSLLELTISSGLIGIAFLAIAGIVKNTTQSQNTTQIQYDIEELMSDIHLNLASKDVCSQNFEGQDATRQNSDSFSELRDESGAILYQASVDLGITRKVQIVDFETEKISDRLVKLTVEIQKDDTANATIFRTVNLNVKLDSSDNIESCFSDFDSSIGDSLDVTCNGAENVFYDNPDGSAEPNGDERCIHIGLSTAKCANDGTNYTKVLRSFYLPEDSDPLNPDYYAKVYVPYCEALSTGTGTAQTCGVGEVMTGLASDGSIICSAITYNDIKDIFDNSGKDCTGKETYSFTNSSGNIDFTCI